MSSESSGYQRIGWRAYKFQTKLSQDLQLVMRCKPASSAPVFGDCMQSRGTHARVSPYAGLGESSLIQQCRQNSPTRAWTTICKELDWTGGNTCKGGGAEEEAITPLKCSTDNWRPKLWCWRAVGLSLLSARVWSDVSYYSEQKEQMNAINIGRLI